MKYAVRYMAMVALMSVSCFLSASEKPILLKILFTHDLHSSFDEIRVPTEYGYVSSGGYARLYSAICDERADKRFTSVLLDAGDFSMGSLYQTLFMQEAAELSLMSRMGYDGATLGNHDFDFHNEGLAKSLETALTKNQHNIPITISNISFAHADREGLFLKEVFAKYPIERTLLVKRKGIVIGIFGLMGKDAASDCPFVPPNFFEDQITSAQRAVADLKKQGADIIVCLSHSGTDKDRSRSEDEILAAAVPDIDVIISGHTHTLLTKPIIVGKTLIGSEGCYGQYLGVVELECKKGTPCRLINYQLRPIDSSLKPDPTIQKLIAWYRSCVDKEYLVNYGFHFDQLLARSQFDFQSIAQSYRLNPWETSMGNLITDADRYEVMKVEGPEGKPIDVTIQALGMIRDHFLAGPISASDIFRSLSLGIGSDGKAGYPLVVGYVTGDELKQIVEVPPSIGPLKDDAWLQFSGIRYSFNPHAPQFQRVVSVEIERGDGKTEPIIGKKLYRVCMNMYLLHMMDYLKAVSGGMIDIHPRDASGRVVANWHDLIVTGSPQHAGGEIKEWMALADYLQTFPVSGSPAMPVIPERYRSVQGRAVPVAK